MGNAIDRVIYGAVADFFDVHAAGYHWPAFNIADAGITVGVVLLLYDALLAKVSGDHDVADRLIAYEQELEPKASRIRLIKNAIHRWERDNRSRV